MKKKLFTALGLMSGTSMDGVDISLIKSDGEHQFISILNEYRPFKENLQKKLINLRSKLNAASDLETYLESIKSLDRDFTLFHGEIINEISLNFNEKIDLVGFHGQTVFHDSKKKISIQLGDGNLLSSLTKYVVVSNFREEDLKNGGQGAPLTPIYHKLITSLINKEKKIEFPILIMNIGGITNLTKIMNDEEIDKKNLFANDIGPGNCLIDEWVRKNSKKKFDFNGNLAKSGKVDKLVLNQVIENFEIYSYDQSLDIKDFDLSFARGLSFEDGCATISMFSAYLIAKGIEVNFKDKKNKPGICLLCGGGRKNSFLIDNIKKYLGTKSFQIENIDNYNFDGDFIESQAFGYLAIRSFLNIPISFPTTTGCKTPVCGGIINKNF